MIYALFQDGHRMKINRNQFKKNIITNYFDTIVFGIWNYGEKNVPYIIRSIQHWWQIAKLYPDITKKEGICGLTWG